jgi:hypothetical protein
VRWALVVVALAGCGDRSPPALWPEAPPPTLAKPIGIDVPVRSATGEPTADAAADTTAVPAPTSADSPTPPGGTPPSTSDPLPRGRLPMPPL